MKCVCGYDDAKYKARYKKFKSFFVLDNFLVHSEDEMDAISILPSFTKKVNACPKCGTLKIDAEENK